VRKKIKKKISHTQGNVQREEYNSNVNEVQIVSICDIRLQNKNRKKKKKQTGLNWFKKNCFL
jgi:hypothetical protein